MAESLGKLLRQKRESLNLELADVEKRTHIRVRHLEAIESDDLSSFASVVQAHGFVRMYTSYLGLSEEDLRNQIRATAPRPAPPVVKTEPVRQVEAKPAEPVPAEAQPTIPVAPKISQPPAPVSPAIAPGESATVQAVPRPITRRREEYTSPAMPRVSKPSPIRRWLSAEFILIGVALLMVTGFLGWGVFTIAQEYAAATPESTLPPLVSVAITDTPSTEALTAESTGDSLREIVESPDEISAETASAVAVETATPTFMSTPLGGIYTTVHIRIEIIQHAFLIVMVDGVETYRNRMKPGDVLEFDGKSMVQITTGNGAGIRVYYNGTDQGVMGNFGETAERMWNLAGAVLPTQMPTETPTKTPSPESGET